MVIAQGLHPLHLMQYAARAVLHLVYFKEHKTPMRLDVEINSRTFPPFKRIGFYHELSGKCNMH